MVPRDPAEREAYLTECTRVSEDYDPGRLFSKERLRDLTTEIHCLDSEVLARRYAREEFLAACKVLQEAKEPVAERREDAEGRVSLNLANVVRRILAERDRARSERFQTRDVLDMD